MKGSSLNMAKRVILVFLIPFGFSSMGISAEPESTQYFNQRVREISRSSLEGEALSRAILNFQAELERSIKYWESQPESDDQFTRESELREIFFRWEPLFKVALNPADNTLCNEQRENLEMDANAGMPEGETRSAYTPVQRLLRRLCSK